VLKAGCVTGHDFRRAESDSQIGRALAPDSLRFFHLYSLSD